VDDEHMSPWQMIRHPRRITGSSPFFPLGVLFGLNAVDELDRMAFAVLTPEIKDHFDLDLQGLLTLTAIILPLGLLLELPIAYFADRRNRVRMAALGAFLWAGFSLLTGVAGAITSLSLLFVARAGSGLAKTLNATHRSLLSDWYPLSTRARVFYAHYSASSIGQITGPLIAGSLAVVLAWQFPFFLLAVPSLLMAFLALRLREPRRGVHERVAAGADAETAEIEERPAGFVESMRVLHSGKSSKRIFLSLPFLAASVVGLITILNLFYDEVYGLGPGARGVLTAGTELIQLVGLGVGAVYVQRVLSENPAKVMRLLGLNGLLVAGFIAGIALSPVLPLSILFHLLMSFSISMLVPGLLSVLSLIIPPRMRTMGFAVGNIYILIGAISLPIVGAIGDSIGLRGGLLVLLPLFVIGALLLSSISATVNEDIARLATMARAQAEVRRRRETGDAQMLIVRDLDLSYDQTQVLFGVDFEVQDGEIVALLGTNGAGKSTLLKAISGLAPASGGVVIFDGEDITGADAIQTARLGIAQVPGGRGIFPSLTVAENLRTAGWLYRKDAQYLKESIDRVVEYFPVLKKRWDTPAGSLSGGEQQMLSLAQAFISRPKLLMIDELSLGLAPTIVERLLDIVRAIHANGTTIILVEQSVNVALRIAKRAVFMEKGEVRFSGPTADLLQRTDILRSVFLKGAAAGQAELTADTSAVDGGSRVRTSARARRLDLARRDALFGNPVVLEAIGLTKRYGGVTAVNGVDLKLHEEQILGLIGPNGAGKTTIFDLLSGFTKLDGGRVLLGGEDVTEWPAWRRAEAGLARSFQDARLWPSLTVREAIATSMKKIVDVPGPLPALFGLPVAKDSEAVVMARVEELIALLGLGAFRDKFVGELSTGSRRMVEIATLLSNDPKVVVLDEPSSGIAQKETEALGPVLKEVQRYTGCSILIIEHDMPLISSLADHIVALELGTVITMDTPDNVLNHPRVVESYLGNTSYSELQAAADGGNGNGNGHTTGNGRRRQRTGP
jgi:ABC-type branched-subunit amino acid transport system ATPase component